VYTATPAAHRRGGGLHLVRSERDAGRGAQAVDRRHVAPAGALTIDAGALRALLEGRSLLPAGVTGARGRFDRGDTVSVLAADGAEIARGMVAYSDVDAARIMGRKSSRSRISWGFAAVTR